MGNQFCRQSDGAIMGTQDKRITSCTVPGLTLKDNNWVLNGKMLDQDTTMAGKCTVFNWSPNKPNDISQTDTGTTCTMQYTHNTDPKLRQRTSTINGPIPYGYQLVRPKPGENPEQLSKLETMYHMGYLAPTQGDYDKYINESQSHYTWTMVPSQEQPPAPVTPVPETPVPETPIVENPVTQQPSENSAPLWFLLILILIMVAGIAVLYYMIYKGRKTLTNVAQTGGNIIKRSLMKR